MPSPPAAQSNHLNRPARARGCQRRALRIPSAARRATRRRCHGAPSHESHYTSTKASRRKSVAFSDPQPRPITLPAAPTYGCRASSCPWLVPITVRTNARDEDSGYRLDFTFPSCSMKRPPVPTLQAASKSMRHSEIRLQSAAEREVATLDIIALLTGLGESGSVFHADLRCLQSSHQPSQSPSRPGRFSPMAQI